MKKALYVSPSILPSRTANSIHVLNQVESLAKTIDSIELIIATTEHKFDINSIKNFYGFSLPKNIKVRHFRLLTLKGAQIQIGFMGALHFFYGKYDRIISRNLYFSAALSIFSIQHLYEAHGLELGWRMIAERYIFRKQRKIICISEALKSLLVKRYKISSEQTVEVLHDGCTVRTENRSISELHDNKFRVGYFGHLYPGRGVEVVIEMGARFPEIIFYIVGGNSFQVSEFKKRSITKNVIFLGYKKNTIARTLMTKMDVLVMPYQQMVSIGPVNSDTSKWMSPLKMFEYMASKVTIISSDLPVLREVLSDSVNCLMVKCDDVDAWCKALKSLQSDALLRKKLSDQAFADVINKYTWDMRASKISKLWKKQ